VVEHSYLVMRRPFCQFQGEERKPISIHLMLFSPHQVHRRTASVSKVKSPCIHSLAVCVHAVCTLYGQRIVPISGAEAGKGCPNVSFESPTPRSMLSAIWQKRRSNTQQTAELVGRPSLAFGFVAQRAL
jgi:hypothetical protein